MSLRSRQEIEAIFQKAADLPADARAAFLDRACGDDSGARKEVEALLACLTADEKGPAGLSLDVQPVDDGVIGSRIGPYRLLELIGEGGFGSVFMAEQEEPVRRRVALKIIKLGMDTRQVIARFEAERQALAIMEHPNIARVLDAGATESGRPYFVMELVQGIPITKYCDREGLSTRDRLRLFLQVCQAVQHAHQKGIIHRDLKPSNVLVTLHDGVAVPKVIDFGIAKATRGRLTDKTLFTAFMQFVGTPQYMSPEQAEMSGLDIDTRSDVYSLGVLLYELLTGTTPCDAEVLKRASYTELQRIIREEDPPTPSRRLSTLGDRLADVARRRGSEPQLLSRLVRGDLDWIVMRALEKDRQRRYESASALAADVQRHLSNEVVLAGPPGSSYRLYKLIRRHRVGFAAGSAVAVALILGLALATWGLVQAQRDRDRALAAEQRAQQQAETAQNEAAAAKAINAFLNDMLTSVDPMQVQLQSAFARETAATSSAEGGFAHDVSVAEMIRRATKELDSAFVGKPELEAESRETLGITLRGLGRYADAEPQLRAALEIRRSRLGEEHPDTLRSQLALGDLLLEAGRGQEAESLVRAAYDAMRTVHGKEDPRTLSCASVLAMVLSDIQQVEESEKLFRETLKAQERVLGESHRDTLTTMWKWSISCLSQWRLVEGQALGRRLYELAGKSLGPDDSLNILSKPLMGWWYLAQYQYADAEAVLRPGLEQCRRILGPKHPFTYMTMHCLARSLQGADVQDQRERLHRAALEGLRATRGRLHWHTISTTTDFARWLDWRGELVEAEHMYRAIVADARQAFGPANGDTVAAMYNLAAFLERAGKIEESLLVWEDRAAIATQHLDSMSSWQNEMDLLCRVLHRTGRVDAARAKAREMLAVLKEVAQKKPDDPLALNDYAWSLLTCTPSDCQDVEEALPIVERAVALADRTEQQSPVLDTLALAYARLGRGKEAIEVQRRSLTMLPEASKADLRYCAQLVQYLIEEGDTEAADQIVREGVEAFRETLGRSNPLLAREFNRMGVFLANSRRLTMAASMLDEGLEINRRVLGEEHEQVALSLQNVAIIRRAQGDLEGAAEAFREALSMRRRLFGDTNLLVASTLREWGETCYLQGRMPEARSAFEETLEVYRRLHAERMPRAVEVRSLLAQVLLDQNELDLAEPLAQSGWRVMRELYGDSHVSTCESRRIVAEVLIKRGRLQEAEGELLACMKDQTRICLPKEELYGLASTERSLGCCLLAMGRYEAAEPYLLKSYQRLEEKYGSLHSETRLTRRRLSELYDAWGKPRLAEQWRRALSAEENTRTAA